MGVDEFVIIANYKNYPETFDRKVNEIQLRHPSFSLEDAYIIAEGYYYDLFGETIYSSFESYYRTRIRRIKKLKSRHLKK